MYSVFYRVFVVHKKRFLYKIVYVIDKNIDFDIKRYKVVLLNGGLDMMSK